MSERKEPRELWEQANADMESGNYDEEWRRHRYHDLLKANGHIVKRKPGESRALPCGWDPSAPEA